MNSAATSAANGENTLPSKPKRRGGVVVPTKLSWGRNLVAILIYLLIRAVSATLRYQWQFHPGVLDPKAGPFIFCTWHNRLPLCQIEYRGVARRRGERPQLAAIVSASRDGAVVARLLELFGAQPVRGSSSRRGAQALLELTTWAERGYDLAVTPDGPRGPRYVVQPGAVMLAQLTGLALAPACYHVAWKIQAKSWDRFQIPLPFSRVRYLFGEPMKVPREATEEQREQFRVEFEKRLLAITED